MLFVLLFFRLLTLILTAPVIKLPSDDDFYEPPPGFEDAKLGTVLKIREAPFKIRSVYFEVKIKKAWQILFRSENSMGNATAVVTTLFEPYNADPSKLLSYQTAEDAASIDCSPSYSFGNTDDFTTIVAALEMFLIQTALNEGYYVSSPDYEGPQAAFTAGIQSGKATLDSIRAVLSTGNTTGLHRDADVVLWGYSGGTIASGWAAALQPSYAKELAPNLKGVAIGGWVTNVTATAESVEGTLFAGLVPSAIAGLTNEYPEFRQIVRNATTLIPAKKKELEKAYDLCLASSIINYAWDSFFSTEEKIFAKGWDTLSLDLIKSVLYQNTLGLKDDGLMPEIPVFVFHGEKDTIVPFKDAQRVYEDWCDSGIASMEFAVSSSTGHITEVIEGSGAAFAWIKKRFEGEEPVKGCTRTERLSNLLYPGSFTSIGDILQALISNVLGDDIGPNAENLTVHGNRLVRKDRLTELQLG